MYYNALFNNIMFSDLKKMIQNSMNGYRIIEINGEFIIFDYVKILQKKDK